MDESDLDTRLSFGPIDDGFCRSTSRIYAPIEHFVDIVDLANILFDQLSPANLLRFARCSRAIYHQVLSYIEHTFNIESLLSRFFSDPTSFRTLQARTHTLISGSTALQFFDRSHYVGSDLDLYTPVNHHLEVGHWLIREGYTYKPGKRQLPSFEAASLQINDKTGFFQYNCWRGVSGIFDFFLTFPDGIEKKVQLIVSTLCPMEVILSFHSSKQLVLPFAILRF
jgi:hypothetical protein